MLMKAKQKIRVIARRKGRQYITSVIKNVCNIDPNIEIAEQTANVGDYEAQLNDELVAIQLEKIEQKRKIVERETKRYEETNFGKNIPVRQVGWNVVNDRVFYTQEQIEGVYKEYCKLPEKTRNNEFLSSLIKIMRKHKNLSLKQHKHLIQYVYNGGSFYDFGLLSTKN